MTISMIGIDHDRAPVDIRALFAFTKKNAGEAMERLKKQASGDASFCLHAIVWKSGRATRMNSSFLYTSVSADSKIYRILLMKNILFRDRIKKQ